MKSLFLENPLITNVSKTGSITIDLLWKRYLKPNKFFITFQPNFDLHHVPDDA